MKFHWSGVSGPGRPLERRPNTERRFGSRKENLGDSPETQILPSSRYSEFLPALIRVWLAWPAPAKTEEVEFEKTYKLEVTVCNPTKAATRFTP